MFTILDRIIFTIKRQKACDGTKKIPENTYCQLLCELKFMLVVDSIDLLWHLTDSDVHVLEMNRQIVATSSIDYLTAYKGAMTHIIVLFQW